MQILRLFTFSAVLSLGISASAQVSAVNYKIKFNPETSAFDAYIKIKDGQSKRLIDKVQFNSQFSIVVPSNSIVSLVNSYNPRINETDGSNGKAAQWVQSNAVQGSTGSLTLSDFYSFVPSLAPTSKYSDIKAGDEVKLFSVFVSGITNCGAEVRMFDNATDPTSNHDDMQGGDFRNGFTMGGPHQIYAGNEETEIPTIKVLQGVYSQKSNQQITLKADVDPNYHFGPLSYVWEGPDGFKSYQKEPKFNTANLKDGVYKLEVTDVRGCKQTEKLEVKNQTLTNLSQVEQNKKSASENESVTWRTESDEEFASIFPNPATNYFNLKVNGSQGSKVSLDILDNSGKIIKAGYFQSTLDKSGIDTNVNIESLVPGIYGVNVIIGSNVHSHKLIVIK